MQVNNGRTLDKIRREIIANLDFLLNWQQSGRRSVWTIDGGIAIRVEISYQGERPVLHQTYLIGNRSEHLQERWRETQSWDQHFQAITWYIKWVTLENALRKVFSVRLSAIWKRQLNEDITNLEQVGEPVINSREWALVVIERNRDA